MYIYIYGHTAVVEERCKCRPLGSGLYSFRAEKQGRGRVMYMYTYTYI